MKQGENGTHYMPKSSFHCRCPCSFLLFCLCGALIHFLCSYAVLITSQTAQAKQNCVMHLSWLTCFVFSPVIKLISSWTHWVSETHVKLVASYLTHGDYGPCCITRISCIPCKDAYFLISVLISLKGCVTSGLFLKVYLGFARYATKYMELIKRSLQETSETWWKTTAIFIMLLKICCE